MPPRPAEWSLRPVRRPCRVGEQSAVVWKRLYRRPPAASFSALGVAQGPPKALEQPNPASSMRISRTLGAPLGGRSCSIVGYFASGSLASYVIRPVRAALGIGRCERCFVSSSLMALPPVRCPFRQLQLPRLIRLLVERHRGAIERIHREPRSTS